MLVGHKKVEHNSKNMDQTKAQVILPCQVFISYTGQDEAANTFAAYLKDQLETQGISIFYDATTLRTGDMWETRIRWHAMKCQVFVCIVSPTYCRRYWCLKELDIALSCQRRILPVYYGSHPKSLLPSNKTAFEQRFQDDHRVRDDPGLVSQWWENLTVRLPRINHIRKSTFEGQKDGDVLLQKELLKDIFRYLEDSNGNTSQQKQRRRPRIFFIVAGVLVVTFAAAAAAVISQVLKSPSSSSSSGGTQDPDRPPNEESSSPSKQDSTHYPPASAPSAPSTSSLKPFANLEELRAAVDAYLQDNHNPSSQVALTYGHPIGTWDVSRVTDMTRLFEKAKDFNEDISLWNVSSVTSMSYMFFDAEAFDQPLDNWDVGRVIDMDYMFWSARRFNHPLNSWDVSAVTNMKNMFWSASSFNQSLDKWNTGKVRDMHWMFMSAVSFNQPLHKWNVKGVSSMSGMFERANAFNQDLCAWGLQLAYTTTVTNMFAVKSCCGGPTQCPAADIDPHLQSEPPGPFCYNCIK